MAAGRRVVLTGVGWREQREKQAIVEIEGERILQVVTEDGVKIAVDPDERGYGLRPLTVKADAVDHPSHYTSDPSGVECIQITRHRNFNVGNAMKYLWRAGLKESTAASPLAKQIEDLKKARWYIADEIKRLEAQRENA